jgi:chromodomain-helicase-DNA-binding protein 1
MLLVGAWKHGFGNWEAVEKDESLGLQGKLFLEEAKKKEKEKGKESKPRIPNAVHLVRRGTYLLEIVHDHFSHVKPSQGPSKREGGSTPTSRQPKKVKSKANGESSGKPSKAAASTTTNDRESVNGKKRKTPDPSSSESESEEQYESMDEEACKEALRPVKRELKRLKQSDELPREEKVRALKECLSAVGGIINKSIAERPPDSRERWRKHLWVFVSHSFLSALRQERELIIYVV